MKELGSSRILSLTIFLSNFLALSLSRSLTLSFSSFSCHLSKKIASGLFSCSDPPLLSNLIAQSFTCSHILLLSPLLIINEYFHLKLECSSHCAIPPPLKKFFFYISSSETRFDCLPFNKIFPLFLRAGTITLFTTVINSTLQ
jgi:hypothetical protein